MLLIREDQIEHNFSDVLFTGVKINMALTYFKDKVLNQHVYIFKMCVSLHRLHLKCELFKSENEIRKC